MTNLDFLNKNMYRKYPLRAECDMIFTDGTQFPQDLITSMQISTVYGVHQLYVTKVYVDPGYISVTVNNLVDGTVIGCFSGKVSSDYTVVPMSSTLSTVSGNMTTGTVAALSKIQKGTYFLRNEFTDTGSRTNSRIEDSVIFCYAPPGVTKIKTGSKSAVGFLTTSAGSNVRVISTSTTETQLTVINENNIMSNNEFSGGVGNCPTPIIKKINSVYPDSNGNIDIYGIMPIVIDVESGELAMSSGLDLFDVCPEKKKIAPPVNTSDTYYTDILSTNIAEWKTWPEFN